MSGLLIRRVGAVLLAFGAMLLLSACSAQTMGASSVTSASADLHTTASCDQGQTCKWYWEYWPASQPRSSSTKTQVFGPVNGATPKAPLTEHITGLQPKTAYRWVFCASPNNGGAYACAGPNGTFGPTTADPPPDFDTFTTPAAWNVQPTPNPTGATGSGFAGVSCTSLTECTAVGNYTNTTGTGLTLAERWDGAAWTIQTTANPIGGGHLRGVSCTSATGCTAVGNYGTSSSTGVTLAERWDGTSWTIQPTPNPTGAMVSYLSGVSCTSATECTAVGTYTTGNTPSSPILALAERWDGTNWTIQPTPNPPTTANNINLYGVSCTSANACTAVGSYFDTGNGHTVTLAERWDSTTWTNQPTPNPTGTTNASLTGVSCTSATACTAIGRYTDSAGNNTTLAESWDGTNWTIQPTPNPNGSAGLAGVSCTSPAACTAAGSYTNSAGHGVTLAESNSG